MHETFHVTRKEKIKETHWLEETREFNFLFSTHKWFMEASLLSREFEKGMGREKLHSKERPGKKIQFYIMLPKPGKRLYHSLQMTVRGMLDKVHTRKEGSLLNPVGTWAIFQTMGIQPIIVNHEDNF